MKIFDGCVVVKGAKNIIIQDNLRNKVIRIPKQVLWYLENPDSPELDENQIKEIYSFMEKHDLIQPFEDEKGFTHSKDIYNSPSIIENCILEFCPSLMFYYDLLFNDLTKLGCKHLEIRFYKNSSIKNLEKLIKIATIAQFLSIDVYYEYSKDDIYLLSSLIGSMPIVNILVVHSIPSFILSKLENQNFKVTPDIILTESIISYKTSCGNIDIDYFSIDFDFYRCAKNFNSCLYKKISIDSDGNIKNCPSMSQSFGNIRDTTLEEALAHPDFKKYWNVKKDDITKCKDCEFRYICTDCRAYIDDPEDMYSAPLKCGYDPYTGVWEEWSTNPLKQKAIAYYGMEDLIAGDKENNV